MTETLAFAAILIPCLIIAIVFHEVAHGWVALMLGDPTAKERNRLSLNPIRHVDAVGTLIVPGALALFGGPIFGWAKPVPVLQDRLNNPRFGMMAVAAAGPLTNLLLAAVGAIVLGLAAPSLLPDPALGPAAGEPGLVVQGLVFFILINVFLALFNLLPIPPFDGSHIVGGLLPESWQARWQKLQALGMLFFVVLIGATWAFPDTGLIENTVLPPVMWMQERYLELAGWVARGIAG